MLTWSSCPADEVIESIDAGWASDLLSDTSDAAVYWASMNPEFSPLRCTRNAGSPLDRAGSSRRNRRRSEMLATVTTPRARASSATATGWPWKFPPDSTSPVSAKTTGLSDTDPISRSRTWRLNDSTSRIAPWTCGAHRSEYASWTRCPDSRCDSMISLPSVSLRRLAADAPCPGCGRSRWRRSSKALSVPSAASTLMAAAMSAALARAAARDAASTPTASIPWVPFTRARPSLGPSDSGPCPSRGRARCASGARSPDAPSEPCSGTMGMRSRFSISIIRSTISGRTPERPRASTWARSSSMARASGRDSGGPTAVAYDCTMSCWSRAACSGSMRTVARLPIPVVTP